MLPVLPIGPFSIQTPGLIILLTLWLGLNLAERHAPKYGLAADTLYNLVFTALIGGLLGGRLIYILQYPSAFLESPRSIISLNPGLFDQVAGLAVGVLSGLVYGQRKALDFWKTLDALTPLLAVLAAGLALAHLAAGTAFGEPADLPWTIELWGARRHPTQIYELCGSLLTLSLIWPRKAISPAGINFLYFVALTSGMRLFLEAFRGDSSLVLGGLRLEQMLAWAALAVTLALLAQREKQA